MADKVNDYQDSPTYEANAFGPPNSFLHMFFPLLQSLIQMLIAIEQTVKKDSGMPPILHIPSSPYFQVMVWAMSSNFRKYVRCASPNPSFSSLGDASVSNGYRFSTSFMQMFLMRCLTTTMNNGKEYLDPKLLKILFKKILSYSLRVHTPTGSMVAFLHYDYKYTMKALVRRGSMKDPFYDILLAIMHCDMIPGVMYMHDGNPSLVLQFAMTILPQLHPGQIEMLFLLKIVSQLLNIAMDDTDRMKAAVFFDEWCLRDDNAEPPKANYEVVGGVEQYELLLQFYGSIQHLSGVIKNILLNLHTKFPKMVDSVSESFGGSAHWYEREPRPYPVNLPNLPQLRVLPSED
jgi:hypothetical protein